MASSPPAVASAYLLPKTPETDVAAIVDRRNEARRWMQINYWDEWEDVYRSSKCLTKKIMVTAKDGTQVEDTSRTNVCMPETSLIIRRKTARLTANMPEIRFTSQTGNTDVEEKLTALNYQNFDRSGEIQQHRMLVQSAVTFGFGVTKLYWDTIEINRKFFKATVDQFPNDPQKQAAAIQKFGQFMQAEKKVKKYEGPCAKNIFIGDFFIEPGAMTVAQSAWAIENFWETDLWLKKMVKKTCIYPDGSEHPIFDPKAAKDLMEMGTWNPNFGTQQPYDLRTRFRTNVLGQQVPLYPVSLIPGKRFDILEQHCRDEDGVMWITWVGNEKIWLGKMPYQWDMYGKYTYTEFVPLFDPLSVYGDSTPRLGRFLQHMHNATVGARKDLVNNILRPIILKKWGEDIPDEAVQRSLFKEVVVKDLNSLKLLHENLGPLTGAISAANEEEGQIMRMFALMEPNINNTESGTQSNPQAGKTATTAVLAAKSADALTQFELDSLNWYLKEQNEKKLAMLQQQEMDSDYDIGQKYFSKVEGLTQRYEKTASISLNFMDIQEEFEVEPVAMSMLSVDDDIRRQAGMDLLQLGGQVPGVVDMQYAARFVAGTIRGIDPDKAVPPPKPSPPPAPKFSVGIQFKGGELPEQVQLQMFQALGAQVTPELQQEMAHTQTLDGVKQLSEAADAAENIFSSAHPEDEEPETNLSKKA